MKTSDHIKQEFGNRVRELRKQKGLSQEDFSFECGLDRTYVSQVEQGKRNISLQNIKAMADALSVPVAALFIEKPTWAEAAPASLVYRENSDVAINSGFMVLSKDILSASLATATQMELLPFSLYQSIDLKTLSSITGAIFAKSLADRVGALVNPIEKGHPDIIPMKGRNAAESQLRNYPEGLEIKVTVGNVAKGSDLQPGIPRVASLTGITWQAHHKEVKSLLGLTVDFAGTAIDDRRYPVVTAAFYTENLTIDDWGEISGTTGRNTKVTGMRSSGKSKMGNGWMLVLDRTEYREKYARLLKFTAQ